MSRHQSSCRDIILCCCRLHLLFVMSRLQLPCRDINLFNFGSFFSCLCLASGHELHHFPLILHDVVTSELYCVDFQAASLTQPSDFISALFLTAFLSTYCCVFILSFSFPANDNLVSFCIILYINYSILTENKTEKWTKKRRLLSSSNSPKLKILLVLKQRKRKNCLSSNKEDIFLFCF